MKRWGPYIAIAGVTAFVAWLAFVALAPDAVYSGDFGVKFVQAKELYDHHFSTLRIDYRGAFLDPGKKFSPLRPPFVFVTSAGMQAIFPPAAAVLQAIFVPLGGMIGMRILSVIAVAVALWATWRLAPRGWAGATLPLVTGLATPLWFYGVIESEHAPAIAVGAVAVVIALLPRDSDMDWRALFAGVALGAAAAVRDESILLMPGLLLACWAASRSWRMVAFAVAGCALTLGVAAFVEVWWFNRPLAAHLRHAVHLLQTALRLTSKPNLELPELHPLTLKERYAFVGQYWLFGTDRDRLIVTLTALLAAGAAARLFLKSAWPLLPAFAVLIVCSATDTFYLVREPKWVAGLFRLSPFLVFAIVPPADGRDRWLWRVALFSLVTYVLLAFAGVDTSGGKSLGPRLLLPLLPLLVASAWRNIADHISSPRSAERLVGAAGLGLTAIAFVIHAASTIPAYVARSIDDASAMRTIKDSAERVIVADDMYTAQQLLPMYYARVILLADSPQAGVDLGEALNREHVGGAVLVSRRPDAVVGLAPYRMAEEVQRGRFRIQYWRR